MRTEGYTDNDLHFHNGGTCHGSPTLKACATEALRYGEAGKILEITDRNENGTVVKCYSMIVGKYDHWAKRGRFVAEVRLTVIRL